MSHSFRYDGSGVVPVYDAARELPAATVQLWLEAIERRMVAPAGRVLDLGCGTGRFSTALAMHFSCDVLGVDPSREALELARARTSDPRVQFAVGSAECIPSHEPFGLVFMSMSYHHVSNRAVARSEIERVLAADGTLAIRTALEEDVRDSALLALFPSALEIELRRMPTLEGIRLELARGGLEFVASDAIEQIFANDAAEYYRKVSLRGLSVLRMISDDEFARGVSRLSEHCQRLAGRGPVIERFHLVVFRRRLA